MKKNVFLLLLTLTLGFLPAMAFAAEGEVTMGGMLILRVRFPAGGLTVQQRADRITDRLTEILGQGIIKPADVRVVTVKKEVAIFVKDQQLITVDRPTADFNKTTPQKLAEIWAEKLRIILPELTPQKDL